MQSIQRTTGEREIQREREKNFRNNRANEVPLYRDIICDEIQEKKIQKWLFVI